MSKKTTLQAILYVMMSVSTTVCIPKVHVAVFAFVIFEAVILEMK